MTLAPAALGFCLAFLPLFHTKGKKSVRWAIRAGPLDRVGGIFLRALVADKARTMVANNPAGMSRPNRLEGCSSRHSHSEGYRQTIDYVYTIAYKYTCGLNGTNPRTGPTIASMRSGLKKRRPF